MLREREQLSPFALQVLEVFELLARRVVLDFQIAPLVFEAARLRLTAADAALFVECLDLVYTFRCPVQRPKE